MRIKVDPVVEEKKLLQELGKQIGQIEAVPMRSNPRKRADRALQAVAEIDLTYIDRKEVLGIKGFDGVKEPLSAVQDQVRKLFSINFDEIPSAWLQNVGEIAEKFLNICYKIINFDPSVSTRGVPSDEYRGELIGSCISLPMAAYEAAFPLVVHATLKNINPVDIDNKIKSIDSLIQNEVKASTDTLSNSAEEAKKILENLREITAKAGVFKESKHFEDASKDFTTSAGKWMDGAINMGTATLVASILLFLAPWYEWFIEGRELPEQAVLWVLVQIALLKTLFIGAGITATLVCIKNYNASKHNAVVNEHRSKALKTFNALVEGGQSLTTRDKILEQAAACIYAPQDTGYLKGKGGDSTSLSVSLPGGINLKSGDSG